MASGQDIGVWFYFEDAFGVDPTIDASNTKQAVYYTPPLGLQKKQNRIRSATVQTGRGTPRSGDGNIDVSGPLSMEVAPENIGYYLAALLGAPSTTDMTTYQDNEFVPTSLPSFQIEQDWTSFEAGNVLRYDGCKMQKATVTFPQEGHITVTFDIVGKDMTLAAAVLAGATNDPGHDGFTGFEGTIKQGGVALGVATQGTLVVENGIDDSLYTYGSSGTRYTLEEGRVFISGQVSYVFEDFDLIDLALAGTETTLTFLLERGDADGTAGDEKMTILVDHCDLTLATPSIDTDSGIIATFDFEGFFSGAEMGLQINLLNQVDHSVIT